MSLLRQDGFELNSLSAEGWTSITGTIATSSGQAHSGSFSCRANPTGGTCVAFFQFTTGAVVICTTQIYLYVASTPVTASARILLYGTDNANSSTCIELTTGGVLQLKAVAGGVQIGSNSAVVSTGAWHKIVFLTDMTTVASTVATAWLDDVKFASGTSSQTGNGTGSQLIKIGAFQNVNTSDLYFDDLAIYTGSPLGLNNYQFVKVGDGMSVSEKIR